MISIRNILVAIDFSDLSPTVMDYACSLAMAWEARLLVVHVVHRQPCCRSRLCVSLLRLRQKLTGPELLYELERTFVCIAHEHRDDEGRAGEGRV